MNNTEILYDHYKDTIEETKKQESRRNKLFNSNATSYSKFSIPFSIR